MCPSNAKHYKELENGRKEFEIISKTDELPNDEYLINIKNIAFDKLKKYFL